MAADVINTPRPFGLHKRPISDKTTPKAAGPFRATHLWNEIVQALKDQVKVKRSRGRMKSYEYCFAGSSAVDVVLAHLQGDKANFSDKNVSREKATKLCQLMMDFHIFQKKGKDKGDHSLSPFEDSSTKFYQFIHGDDQEIISKENDHGFINQACSGHDDFLRPESRLGISKEGEADVGDKDIDTSQSTSTNKHGQVVQDFMELTGSWKRYSAECLKKMTPAKLFQRRPSLQDTSICSSKSDTSIDVDRLPPAVEEELVKEVALSQLLTLVDLPILENILSYDSVSARSNTQGGIAYSNLAFRRYESIYSILSDRSDEDTWWEAGLDCLENHPKGLEILDDSLSEGTDLTQKLRMYQSIADHYTGLTEPLWSDKFVDLHLGLFKLLMQSQQDVAMKALQLAMILLHNQEREELRRLLRFLKYAADDDAICISSVMGNRELIEKTFTSCVVKNKIMTPHQSGQLFLFMVDRAFEMWDTPEEVEDAVFTRMRAIIKGRTKLPRIEKTYCAQVSEDEYKKQQTVQTETSLVALMNSILDNTKFSLKEKKQRLKQFQKHHPDLYQAHFSDML